MSRIDQTEFEVKYKFSIEGLTTFEPGFKFDKTIINHFYTDNCLHNVYVGVIVKTFIS